MVPQSSGGGDGVPPFDGDRVPRAIEWADDEHLRMYRSYSAWKGWKRKYTKRRRWIRQKDTRGVDGWAKYRNMIARVRDIPLKMMLEEPNNNYQIKALDAPREGDYSMRYNQEIRLEFTYSENVAGELLAHILAFGFHYGD